MPFIPDSILDTTKKSLGLDADYEAFDIDIILLINSNFSTFQQIGIGPVNGFAITDRNQLWSDFTKDEPKLNSVKSLMYHKVRYAFDPPQMSFVLTALENQIKELEWRLNIACEPFDNIDLTDESAIVWELEAPDVFPPEAKSGELGIYLPTKEVWRKP